MHDRTDQAPLKTDWVMFITTAAVIAMICLPIVAFHDQAAQAITSAYDAITNRIGILYLWYGTGLVAFLVWLAFSRFGEVKLGDADDKPEFSTLKWVAMLFCAGVGAGLL